MAFDLASPAGHFVFGPSGWKQHGCLLLGMASGRANIHALLGAVPARRTLQGFGRYARVSMVRYRAVARAARTASRRSQTICAASSMRGA